jgi:hypothetical protein
MYVVYVYTYVCMHSCVLRPLFLYSVQMFLLSDAATTGEFGTRKLGCVYIGIIS